MAIVNSLDLKLFRPYLQTKRLSCLGNNEAENLFIPFDTQYNLALKGRPLGHQYLRNDLATLMDGIIFNQRMERPVIDKRFAATFIQIIPISEQVLNKLSG